MLRSESERGEGRLGSIIWLLIVGGVLYASWNLIPAYFSNYNFADKMTELARAPKYSHPDDRIESIVCEYDRTVQILPGFQKKIHFKSEADQPLI